MYRVLVKLHVTSAGRKVDPLRPFTIYDGCGFRSNHGSHGYTPITQTGQCRYLKRMHWLSNCRSWPEQHYGPAHSQMCSVRLPPKATAARQREGHILFLPHYPRVASRNMTSTKRSSFNFSLRKSKHGRRVSGCFVQSFDSKTGSS